MPYFINKFDFKIGQATLTPINILNLPQLELTNVASILEWVFLPIVPNYALGYHFLNIFTK